jgi:HK97 family phage portal protein
VSLLFARDAARTVQRTADLAALEIAYRDSRRGGRGSSNADAINEDTAMRHSAVWACVRLRADLMSSFPVDVYRDFEGIPMEVAKPPIFVTPDGDEWPWQDWTWASQSDLDRCGNTVGLIVETNSLGLPSRIELANTRNVSLVQRREWDTHKWRINGTIYEPNKVWHERQFPVSGMILGMSPIAYAAWSISEYLSIQDFAAAWYAKGGIPAAKLRNTERPLKPNEAVSIKERWKASMENGDLFVTGRDWEYDLIQAEQVGMEWIEGRKINPSDIARFFGAPTDLIEAAAATGSGQIRYGNITQRNLQFLIMHLQPAIQRRENTWSRRLLPMPRYVKLNTGALLRLDPETQQKVLASKLESHQMVITEARELEDRAPYTAAQEKEAEKWFPPKAASAPAAGKPATDQPDDQPEGGDQG